MDGQQPHDQERDSQPARRSAFRALVQDFSPLWFTICMNCGVVAVIMHQFPYNSHWIRIVGTILFIIDIVLFIGFGTIMLLRLMMFRKQAIDEITSNADDLAFLGNMPIAWLTITALVSLIVSRASWGGHWATILAYVMWWIGAAWMIITAWTVYVILARKHELHPSSITTSLLIPAVGVATVATEGALISSYSHAISARMAVPIIIFSFMCVGFGLFLAVMIYSLFMHRLLTSGFPEPKRYFTLTILTGPLGQSATALVGLGSAAYSFRDFEGYHKGTFLQASAASSLSSACILGALLLLGLVMFWLGLIIYALIEGFTRRGLTWAPTANTLIFPLGTVCTAWLELSIVMDSPTFRTLTAIFLVILVVLLLVNFVFISVGLTKGQVLIVRDDPRVKYQ